MSNWSYGAWISAVVICFGSSVPVPGVHTWGRNWLDFTHVLWADFLNIAYWISEIKQLPILWLTTRMFVRFHAPFNLYESTNPFRFLTRERYFFLQHIIPGRNQSSSQQAQLPRNVCTWNTSPSYIKMNKVNLCWVSWCTGTNRFHTINWCNVNLIRINHVHFFVCVIIRTNLPPTS